MRSLLVICIVALAAPAPASAQTVTCADGTTSEAGRGACSYHGGVAKTRAPRQAEPKRETTRRTTTARTRCEDGTYSSATGRGACSGHGGVADDTDRGERTEPARKVDRAEPTRKADRDRAEPTRKVDRNTNSSLVVQCADGTISIATGRGACSHHGGVADAQPRTRDIEARTPTRDTRSPRRDTRDTRRDKPWWGDEGLGENEPMARCMDGTISYSRHRRGTCSSHGGVREWLDE